METRSRILIVDDEPSVRLTLEMALADTPHQVESVETAEKALAAIDREPFDLLIVDKNLPGMNGVELIRRVRQKHEDVWSAMITGYPSADSAMEMLHLGVRGYLEKPFEDVYEVVKRIEGILEAKRKGKRLQGAVDRMRSAVQRMPSARSLKVLIVSETDQERRWLQERTVSAMDSGAACASGHEALAILQQRAPDLIVCDAAMKQPDLFSFIHAARRAAPDVALVVICDAPSLRMLTELIDIRAAAVIQRPISDASYRSRIDPVLHRLRLTDPSTAHGAPPPHA